MAQTPEPLLTFHQCDDSCCGDCGERQVDLPQPLPPIGDDFDWLLRDYDGFRLFILEELAARFPERRRWTPADMEVVIVEALAVVLDQLSDTLDRVQAEAFLETARQPESVRRLLAMIGYDAVAEAGTRAAIPDAVAAPVESHSQRHRRLLAFQGDLQRLRHEYAGVLASLSPLQRSHLESFCVQGGDLPDTLDAVQVFLDRAPEFVQRAQHRRLGQYWQSYPHAMDAARQAGPRHIHRQRRMVTVADYAERMEEHPLVLRAHAFERWTGSWSRLYCAVILPGHLLLDQPLDAGAAGGELNLARLQSDIDLFHRRQGLRVVDWSSEPSPRTVLRPYLDRLRMATQEVLLLDADLVGIDLTLAVRIDSNYFQSEVKRAVLQALGVGLGGFFAPGRLQFGEDLHGSDIIEVVMALDGVEVVCLNRFKRVGKRFANQADSGRIILDGLELAVCRSELAHPALGRLKVNVHGGRRG